jgi:hypothetical protein
MVLENKSIQLIFQLTTHERRKNIGKKKNEIKKKSLINNIMAIKTIDLSMDDLHLLKFFLFFYQIKNP